MFYTVSLQNMNTTPTSTPLKQFLFHNEVIKWQVSVHLPIKITCKVVKVSHNLCVL